MNKFKIKGIGKCLPEKVVSSSEIEQKLGLPTGWVEQSIGVQQRYIATHESNTSLGAKALENALNDAQMNIQDIDCLIAAGATFDYVIPNRSSSIKGAFEEAKNTSFPCLDINTVCTSFITALDYASLMLSSSVYKNIAIVSSEISSHGLNPADAKTYSLFGDAAAAFILSSTSEEAGQIQHLQQTFSEGVMDTVIQGGGNAFHPKAFPYHPALYSFQMEGKKLLKLASKQLPIFFDTFFQKAQTSLAEVDWIIPHQASLLGLRILARLNQGKTSNIINQLSKYGNCVAASIPLALVLGIEEGKIQTGDTCFLIGTGAGVSISGLLFVY